MKPKSTEGKSIYLTKYARLDAHIIEQKDDCMMN